MGRRLIEDNRAQVSAELIIVMAATLAIALLFLGNLNKTVTGASEAMTTKSQAVVDQIGAIPTPSV